MTTSVLGPLQVLNQRVGEEQENAEEVSWHRRFTDTSEAISPRFRACFHPHYQSIGTAPTEGKWWTFVFLLFCIRSETICFSFIHVFYIYFSLSSIIKCSLKGLLRIVSHFWHRWNSFTVYSWRMTCNFYIYICKTFCYNFDSWRLAQLVT
jgi:cellulose synthase/poly-beta-1,6-N-acetylglucosamine synthase-like glycosyltransferase